MSSCPAPIRSPPRSRPPADLASRSASLRAASARTPFLAPEPVQTMVEVDVVAAKDPASPSRTASSAASPAWPDLAASASMWASRTGQCQAAHALAGFSDAPVRVERAEFDEQRPVPQSAPAAGGGSRKARLAGSATPKPAQASSNSARSACRISGRREGRQRRRLSARQSLSAMPGSVRPARPARWSTDARAARTVSSRVSPVAGSKDRLPRQPAIDDDAHAVDGNGGFRDRRDSTSLRRPASVGRLRRPGPCRRARHAAV